MRIIKALALAVMLTALLLPATAFAAEVAQGECVSYDAENKIIVIEEYDTNFDLENRYGHPTGIITEFDATSAKIGILPEEGDILRIAFVVEGSKKMALKVMNVTKQDLMAK
ncbi:hypothetical protein DPQ33_17115 [Oceanidesulfovibrio indonesiensis]|uniref:Uncharacterized protein n=1 Tax=Oceanidesulfovibrio indonesiensis TaxID=54767 RepID=A0A7M3MB38_9BACT|nr:hypothetical protein [Oceanidesulfovibrio indonesiensis]TVM14587.1 hypothetical protein DPQ33_17115 [Oceanidesulfovibrio indonesiensis]